MRQFNWKKDFNSILWKETIVISIIRGFSVGIVQLIVGLISMTSQKGLPPNLSGGMIFLFPFIMVVMSFGAIIIGLLCEFLSYLGVPFIRLLTLMFSIGLAIGDPLVYILHKAKPKWVPIKEYGFFNLTLVIFALKE